MRRLSICVDFDGTVVQSAYPEIGEPVPGAFNTLQQLKAYGHKLILFTCREDSRKRKYLTEAVKFCEANGVRFDGVNETLPCDEFRDEDQLRRKPHCDFYIDDRMIGGFPGWEAIGKVLMQDYLLMWAASRVEAPEVLTSMLQGTGETKKAHDRRVREGWFEKYAPEDQPGIDIGCKYDALNTTFRRWDLIFGDGDATEMAGVPENIYNTCYVSHLLEHLINPLAALKRWYEILRPSGHLIIVVPHRDLYEGVTTLPSHWNEQHKWLFLPDRTEPPHTVSLYHLVEKSIPGEIVSCRVLDEGYDKKPNQHPTGEYSIELIVRKP